jgi:putative transposase
MIGHQPLELLAGVLGGFKRSSQHQMFSLMAAARQAPLPAFSSPGSFSVGH